MIYQCIAQFFIFNLFVSSILDAFIERADNRSLPRLSEDQRDWVKAHVALLGTEAAAQSGAAVQSEQPGTRLQQLRKRLQDLIKVSSRLSDAPPCHGASAAVAVLPVCGCAAWLLLICW